jgi:hypothetical protein
VEVLRRFLPGGLVLGVLLVPEGRGRGVEHHRQPPGRPRPGG